jgi:hypothetical protein
LSISCSWTFFAARKPALKSSMPMIETTTICRTPACAPSSCRFPRGGDEELGGRPLVGGRVGCGVDHGLHARHRLGEALAGDDVDADGAGDR